MKKILFIFFIVGHYAVLGQVNKIQIDLKIDSTENLNNISKIVNGLKDYEEARKMDSIWMAAKFNSPLNNNSHLVMQDSELLSLSTDDTLLTSKLKLQLDSLHHKTPFNIAYNPVLERVIKTYLKNRRKAISNLMTRAKFYFPMFETKLDKYDIPLEMKYLAIVESALRPNARSKSGAKGLWQFMYNTGKQFNLNVNSYIDERADPLKSTEAACKYLSSLYNTFKDWDLALAAYNAGPGNVTKAIRRSGGYKNYWNIRPYLPIETQGYVPAFYATMYVFEFGKDYKLFPNPFSLSYFETDTIKVKKQLTFKQIAKALKIDNALLQQLNPQYKLNIIPALKDKYYSLRLPYNLVGVFVSNEASIYAYAKADDAKREKPIPKYFNVNKRLRYRVKSGDNLSIIARKYWVTVGKIKRWNMLKSSRISIGQYLIIFPNRLPTVSKNKSKSNSYKGKYRYYIVKQGDSLWSIAKKYPKITLQQIKKWNNIWDIKKLKPGIKLKLYKS